MNALLRTPDVFSIEQASERAPLYLLAAAARCAQNALIVEHRDIFEPPIDAHDPTLPCAVSLAALQVYFRLDELVSSLQLYEATLRDHLRAKLTDDLPF